MDEERERKSVYWKIRKPSNEKKEATMNNLNMFSQSNLFLLLLSCDCEACSGTSSGSKIQTSFLFQMKMISKHKHKAACINNLLSTSFLCVRKRGFAAYNCLLSLDAAGRIMRYHNNMWLTNTDTSMGNVTLKVLSKTTKYVVVVAHRATKRAVFWSDSYNEIICLYILKLLQITVNLFYNVTTL